MLLRTSLIRNNNSKTLFKNNYLFKNTIKGTNNTINNNVFNYEKKYLVEYSNFNNNKAKSLFCGYENVNKKRERTNILENNDFYKNRYCNEREYFSKNQVNICGKKKILTKKKSGLIGEDKKRQKVKDIKRKMIREKNKRTDDENVNKKSIRNVKEYVVDLEEDLDEEEKKQSQNDFENSVDDFVDNLSDDELQDLFEKAIKQNRTQEKGTFDPINKPDKKKKKKKRRMKEEEEELEPITPEEEKALEEFLANNPIIENDEQEQFLKDHNIQIIDSKDLVTPDGVDHSEEFLSLFQEQNDKDNENQANSQEINEENWFQYSPQVDSTNLIINEKELRSKLEEIKKEGNKHLKFKDIAELPDFNAESFKEILELEKSEDVEIVDVTRKSTEVDYFIVAHASTAQHRRAIIDNVIFQINKRRKIIKEYFPFDNPGQYSVEGRKVADWIALSYDQIVIHIFSKESREYYKLEHFWNYEVEEDETEEISIQDIESMYKDISMGRNKLKRLRRKESREDEY